MRSGQGESQEIAAVVKEMSAMKFCEQWSRRDMMKALGMGLAGAATLPVLDQNAFAGNTEAAQIYRSRGGRSLYQHPAEPSSAALIKGNDRSENIYKALKLIEDQVLERHQGQADPDQAELCANQQSTGRNACGCDSRHSGIPSPALQEGDPDRRSGGHQGRHDGRVQELRVLRPGAKVQSQTG